MKKLYCIFFFFLSLNGFSQSFMGSYEFISTYEHYYSNTIKCTKETLLSIKVDSISITHIQTRYKTTYFLLVKKGDKMGLFTENCRQSLPIAYDSIIPTYNDTVFIAYKERKCGVIGINNEIIHPFEYENILIRGYDIFPSYLLQKKGKVGVLYRNFKKIAEPVFDTLYLTSLIDYEYFASYGGQGISEEGYVGCIVVKNGVYGLNDTLGNQILSPEYRSIRATKLHGGCTDNIDFFTVMNDHQKYGLFDEKGNSILPCVYDSIVVDHRLLDSCGSDIIRIAIAKQNGKYKAFNIVTGEFSSEYEKLVFSDKWIFFLNRGKWGVLDHNFEELIKSLDGPPCSFDAYDGYYSGSVSYFDEMSFDRESIRGKNGFMKEHGIVHNDSIICYGNEGYDNHLDYKYGLADVRSGYNTGLIFSEIVSTNFNDQEYLWGFNHKNVKTNNWRYDGELTIMRDDLKTLKTYSYKDFYKHQLNDWETRKQPEYSLAILKNENDLVGALNSKGDLIIPFKYDSIVWNYATYIVWEKGKSGLFDYKGKQILPLKYYGIHYRYQQNGCIVKETKKDNSWAIVDSTGNFLIRNCDEILWMYPKDQKNDPEYMFSKNGYLNLIIDRKIISVDSSFLKFTDPLIRYNTYLIDRNGLIILKGNIMKGQYILDYKKEYYYLRTDKTAFISNSTGTKTMKIENVYHIQAVSSERIGVIYQDKTSRSFNPKTWEWEK